MSLECERGRIFDKEVSQVLAAQLKKVESARYIHFLRNFHFLINFKTLRNFKTLQNRKSQEN